jgi:hypothetical protein
MHTDTMNWIQLPQDENVLNLQVLQPDKEFVSKISDYTVHISSRTGRHSLYSLHYFRTMVGAHRGASLAGPL